MLSFLWNSRMDLSQICLHGYLLWAFLLVWRCKQTKTKICSFWWCGVVEFFVVRSLSHLTLRLQNYRSLFLQKWTNGKVCLVYWNHSTCKLHVFTMCALVLQNHVILVTSAMSQHAWIHINELAFRIFWFAMMNTCILLTPFRNPLLSCRL